MVVVAAKLPAPTRRRRALTALVRPDPAPAHVTLLRRAAVTVLGAGLIGAAAVGAGTAARPALVPVGAQVGVAGFPALSQVSFTVAPGPGLPLSARAHCLLEARTAAARARGLMGLTGLGRYVGMLFTFPGPSTAVFTMDDTYLPLTLAWFDAHGRYLDSLDMIPCPDGGGCPYYYSHVPFSEALEVPQGTLASLGIGPGSVLHTDGPCIT